MLAALLCAQASAAEPLRATEPAIRSLADKGARLTLSADDQARFDQRVQRRPHPSILQPHKLDKKQSLPFSVTNNQPHDSWQARLTDAATMGNSWPGMQLNQHGAARALPRLAGPGDIPRPIPFAGRTILGALPLSHSPLGRAALWGTQPGVVGYRANALGR